MKWGIGNRVDRPESGGFPTRQSEKYRDCPEIAGFGTGPAINLAFRNFLS